jgi:hypothetical protein
MLPVALFGLVLLPLAAQDPVPLPGTRLAFKTDSGQVVLIGSHHPAVDPSEGLDKLPFVGSSIGRLRLVTPADVAKLGLPFEKDLRLGQTWQVYTGSGPAAPATVARLAYLDGECAFESDAAIANFRRGTDQNRIRGLRGSVFLAAPGAGWANVSQEPFTLGQDKAIASAASQIITTQAKAMVRAGKRNLEDTYPDEAKDHAKALNAALLATQAPPLMHQYHWRPRGAPKFIFVEALWVDPDGTPIFGATAIFLQQDAPAGTTSLRLVNFDPNVAMTMIYSDSLYTVSTLDEFQEFQNAWKIGDRYFIARKTNWISLEELNLKTGELRSLLEAGGSGCD